MQTTNNVPIHIKAVLNNEFRRFSLNKASFSLLEETIRIVYSLDPAEKLKICFVDDEKDNVAMSSDEEFLYAADLVRPVRLVITLASSCVPAQTGEANSCQVEPHSVEQPFHCRRGRGRGHCRDKQGWHEERMKRKMEDSSLPKEERIQRKIAKISEKITHIEALLLTNLPAPRERTLSWKLERLQFKLARLQSWSEAGTGPVPEPETPLTPLPTEAAAPFRRGCRGRGGRGRGGFGRGKWSENTEDAGCGQIDYQIWENIRTCRKNLKAANQSGNQEEINRCSKALEDAKNQKWEAKQKAKAAHREGREGNRPEPKLFEQKSRKRECMKNLREAKASGDAAKIEAAEQALIDAKEALQKAKVASQC